MQFDKRVGDERKQFATQVAHINPEVLKVIAAGFSGKESTEFYEGLLAGYTDSYQIVRSLANGQEYLGALIAYISDVLEERS
jgi:hypothetical protein